MKKENVGGCELVGLPLIGWVAGFVGFAGLLGPTKSLPPPFVPTQATRNTQEQINTSELSYLRF